MPPRHDEPGDGLGSGSGLFIGYNFSDKGNNRPLAKGTRFWASPFIEVSTADPTTGEVPAGVPATISAMVQNGSQIATALGVKATFVSAVPGIGGPTNIAPIGESQTPSLGAGLAYKFECDTPFIPSLAAGTHQCLLVRVEGLNDQITNPTRADLDRHVGQKNLTVTERAEQQMTLTITNPLTTEGLATVVVSAWRVKGLTPELAGRLGAAPWDLLAHAGTAPLQNLLVDYGAEVHMTDPVGLVFDRLGEEGPFEPYDEDTMHQLRERQGEGIGGPIVTETVLAPASQRQVVFTSNPPQDPDGWAYVHHLVQRIDDIEIGGYTIIANSSH